MTQTKTYPLRLPRSLKNAVDLQSKKAGTSTNQFVATAVAEKLSALQTAEFFAGAASLRFSGCGFRLRSMCG